MTSTTDSGVREEEMAWGITLRPRSTLQYTSTSASASLPLSLPLRRASSLHRATCSLLVSSLAEFYAAVLSFLFWDDVAMSVTVLLLYQLLISYPTEVIASLPLFLLLVLCRTYVRLPSPRKLDHRPTFGQMLCVLLCGGTGRWAPTDRDEGGLLDEGANGDDGASEGAESGRGRGVEEESSDDDDSDDDGEGGSFGGGADGGSSKSSNPKSKHGKREKTRPSRREEAMMQNGVSSTKAGGGSGRSSSSKQGAAPAAASRAAPSPAKSAAAGKQSSPMKKEPGVVKYYAQQFRPTLAEELERIKWEVEEEVRALAGVPTYLLLLPPPPPPYP